MRTAPLVAAVIAASTITAFTQPTFSSRIDGVRVDVLVTDSAGKPLRGLTAPDFLIRDNGVIQQVDVVSFGELSLDVGLAFDLSESVVGARLEQLRTASDGLLKALLVTDRSALVTFNRAVSVRCRLSPDHQCIPRALADANPTGETALVDGVLAGMIAGESDAGRSLLMVFSDGLDTASFMRAERVLDMARHSDVVVYPIAARGARPDFLADLAALTGGRLHEVDRNEDLSRTFTAILDEFRYRYLVTFTPRSVPRGGWHALDVRVNRPGARVKARPGYQSS